MNLEIGPVVVVMIAAFATTALLAAFALVNLYQHRKRLVPLGA